MPSRKPRISIPIEKDVAEKLEAIASGRDVSVATVARELIDRGMEQTLHIQSIPTSSRTALFYLGRQMYRDRLPMPSERDEALRGSTSLEDAAATRVLMMGWRFERDMQVELEERLNNLEES